jgi:hypothetical protein
LKWRVRLHHASTMQLMMTLATSIPVSLADAPCLWRTK